MRLLEVLLFTLGGIWQGIRLDFNLLELAAVAAGVYCWRSRNWRPARLKWPAIRHPALAAIALALGSVALRLALIPVMRVPVPVVTDEFSHLLLADTLLHGRVTNPTPALWRHFESLHVLMKPHYVSDFFPAQALFLAAGRLATGNAWAGVLAECALFLMALYWMLRGWMPARWALFGLLLAGLRLGVGSYWINNLHGGFLPALGGALAAGAFARLNRRPSPAQGLVFGAGLAILASVRPVEGFLYSLPFALALAWKLRRNLLALSVALLPVALALAANGAYFARVTGSPFLTAYQVNQKTYGWPMTLALFTPPRLHNDNPEIQRYYEFELTEHERVDGPIHFVQYLTFRVQEYWRFFLGPVLSVPLLMLGRVWRRRRMLLLGAAGGLFAVLLEGGMSPHYLAPATAVIVAIVVECCRHLRASRIYIVRFLPASLAAVLALRIGAQAAGLPYTQKVNFQSWCCRVEGQSDKERIGNHLRSLPGNHLVLVKFKTDENNLFQWIYNDAELDATRILWARDLGPASNAALIAQYKGRTVWLVDPNVTPALLSPAPDKTPYTSP